jgi:hypothetical protein
VTPAKAINQRGLYRFRRALSDGSTLTFGKVLATRGPKSATSRLLLRVRFILEHIMKPKHHFDTNEFTRRAATLTWKMIVDLDRYVQLLDCDIATEERRVGISDRSDHAYPILARMLTTRRNNLKDTITVLERRLSKLDQAEMDAHQA